MLDNEEFENHCIVSTAFHSIDPIGNDWQVNSNGLNYGSDLVRLIRDEYGEYFTICVAGRYSLQ